MSCILRHMLIIHIVLPLLMTLQESLGHVEAKFSSNMQAIRSENVIELGLSHEALKCFSDARILCQTSNITISQCDGDERKHKCLHVTCRPYFFSQN